MAELTSSASADALSAGYGPDKADSAAGVWSIHRQIVVRENALQKALARLRELLKEDDGDTTGSSKSSTSKKKSVKRSVKFESRRGPSQERSPERGTIPKPHSIQMISDPLPVRTRRRSLSPSVSGEDSAEIIDNEIEDL